MSSRRRRASPTPRTTRNSRGVGKSPEPEPEPEPEPGPGPESKATPSPPVVDVAATTTTTTTGGLRLYIAGKFACGPQIGALADAVCARSCLHDPDTVTYRWWEYDKKPVGRTARETRAIGEAEHAAITSADVVVAIVHDDDYAYVGTACEVTIALEHRIPVLVIKPSGATSHTSRALRSPFIARAGFLSVDRTMLDDALLETGADPGKLADVISCHMHRVAKRAQLNARAAWWMHCLFYTGSVFLVVCALALVWLVVWGNAATHGCRHCLCSAGPLNEDGNISMPLRGLIPLDVWDWYVGDRVVLVLGRAM